MSTRLENNLSQGSVTKQLLKFSLPFLASNLIQSLYSVADMVIVGQFSGKISMSGVNIGSQAAMLITNLVMGLAVAATVLIGQYVGAEDRKAISETIGTLLTSMFFAGVGLTVVMLFLGDPILRLMQTPKEAFEESSGYLFITVIGILFIFGYNALSAVMRGMGDSKSPMIFVLIACVLNIALDLLMVGVFDMKARGAAIATVFSQAVSMILCVIYLTKNRFVFDFKPGSFRIIPARLKLLLKVGIPTSIQNVATGLSFIFLTSMVNSIGLDQSAAVGAVGKLNTFAILPAMAMSSSISAMSAHNFGAGEEKRAIKTMRTGMLIAFSISATIFVLMNIFPQAFLSIFGDDAGVIDNGVEYLRSFSFDYLIVPFLFCFGGFFIGSGNTIYSLIGSTISAIFVRIPAAYLLGIVFNQGLRGIGLAAPLASVMGLGISIFFFASKKWRKQVIR